MKTKQLFLSIISTICFAGFINAQTPNFVWARQTNGNGNSNSMSISTDAAGNSYIIGDFIDTLYVGSFKLVPLGCYNVYIAKYDPAGNVLWAKKIYNGAGYDIVADAAGNFYITGYFVMNTTIGSFNLSSKGMTDMIIAKFDTWGNPIWITTPGNSYMAATEYGSSIEIDAAGNSYVAGTFSDSAMFGSTKIMSAGSSDIFVAKFNPAGQMSWVKTAGGINIDMGYGIALDPTGNCFVTGNFIGTAWFGNTSFTSGSSNGLSYWDVFVTKYDNAGNLLWAKQAGSPMYDYGSGITADAAGNCIVTGHFMGTAQFDNITVNTQGGRDIFVAKYDGNGNALWVNTAGGLYDDYGKDIDIDAAGNTYVTGNYYGSATFGNTNFNSSGYRDIFIAKYTSTGTQAWVKSATGSNSNSYYNSISVHPSGDLYVSGSFGGSVVMGGTTLTATCTSCYEHAYVGRLSSETTAVGEREIFMGTSIYPNPTSGNATLEYTIEKNVSQARLELYNMTGELVSSITLEGDAGAHKAFLSLDKLPGGVYLAVINAEGKRHAAQRITLLGN